MRAKLANLNHSAVPFLSRAAVNLCWYYYTCVDCSTSRMLTMGIVSNSELKSIVSINNNANIHSSKRQV